MKKLFLLFGLIAFIVAPVFSQDGETTTSTGISFGVKAGVNFASLTGDDADDEELEGRTGFHAGGVVNIPVSELFAVQPEIIYSEQGFTFDDEGEVTGRLNYINVPVLADFTLADGFSLQGGPQLGFNICHEFEYDGHTMNIPDATSVVFAAAIGAQYRLPIGLFFQARYVAGISDVDDADDNFEARNSVISISTGWFFN